MTQRSTGAYVLVVDDEPGLRELLTRILESAGCEVRTAGDAQSALRIMVDTPPAVAICDVHMPGRDGVWLAHQIRLESPATAIVFATSDDTIPPEETFRKGIVAYLVKPFQRHAVLSAVADAFRWASAESGQALHGPILPPRHTASTETEATGHTAPDTADSTRAAAGALVRSGIAATVVCALIAFALYGFTVYRTPARALALAQASSGVVIATDAEGQRLQQGSAFFVGSDLVVTNHHVVAGAVAATIQQAHDDVFVVSGVVASDRVHDLVLLKTTRVSSAYLALSKTPPDLGDEISVYGAPLGLAGTLSKGIISAEPVGAEEMLQISAPISPGSSGSPVLNGMGDVIGVATGSRIDGQNLNYAVPAKYVTDLMRSARAVGPLISVARGAGNDLERYELLGSVRIATTVTETFEPATVSRTVVIFDRHGRLVEETLRDGGPTTQYEYDEAGHVRVATERAGDTEIARWNFSAATPLVIEGVGSGALAGWTRRLEYVKDGRLLSDELRRQDRPVGALTRWVYPELAWPRRIGSEHLSLPSAQPAQDQYDALGNVTRRVQDDGTELLIEYRFDRRANWTSRETIRIGGDKTRTVVGRRRRDIQYW